MFQEYKIRILKKCNNENQLRDFGERWIKSNNIEGKVWEEEGEAALIQIGNNCQMICEYSLKSSCEVSLKDSD